MYDIAISVILYILSTIMICIIGAWVYLLRSMSVTFRNVPSLDMCVGDKSQNYSTNNCDISNILTQNDIRNNKSNSVDVPQPLVSVIIPARNETNYIQQCLDSLTSQSYDNYEIIAIDDSSDDDTFKIITRCAKDHPELIVPVSARQKPDDWMGKNWACMEGYQKAKGDLLLFTDADTHHDKDVITLAVRYFYANKLDALTVMPKMLAPDFWVKSALPMISVFLHTRFSALKVNDPNSKTGYFFGSFFILKRQTYLSIGTHKSVRGEVIEDGALGRKTKEAGYNMRMVKGEHLIDAIWARNFDTLWHALKRLIIPLRAQNGFGMTLGIVIAVAFLLFAPFLSLASGIFLLLDESLTNMLPALVMVCASGVASVLVWIGAILESKTGLHIGSVYGLFAPLGGFMISAGFFAGLLRSNPSVVWRGRRYNASDMPSKQFAAI